MEINKYNGENKEDNNNFNNENQINFINKNIIENNKKRIKKKKD